MLTGDNVDGGGCAVLNGQCNGDLVPIVLGLGLEIDLVPATEGWGGWLGRRRHLEWRGIERIRAR